MQRVWVVGNAGSGKTTLGRALAAGMGVPYLELDAIFHQPGWTELDVVTFRAAVTEVVSGDGWVVDGNYRAVGDLVLGRADTVVFIDLPRRQVMRQVAVRTVGRVLRRAELWNGNREPFSNLWRLDPEKSIMAWAWTQHAGYRDRYLRLMASPEGEHATFLRLTSRKDAEDLLRRLGTAGGSR